MHEFFLSLEQTGLSTWIRESDYGFAMVLTVHTIALSLIIGPNVVVAMRMMGLVPTIPLKPLRFLVPFMWVGIVLAFISGIGLGMAHASTRLWNPILGFKLVVIAAAIPQLRVMQRIVAGQADGKLPEKARMIGASQLILWFVVLVVGRLIAYSATILGEGY